MKIVTAFFAMLGIGFMLLLITRVAELASQVQLCLDALSQCVTKQDLIQGAMKKQMK